MSCPKPRAGTNKELQTNGAALIAHDELAHFMPAMTMAFNVRNSNEVPRLQPEDRIAFRLHVTEDKSWIDKTILNSKAAAHREHCDDRDGSAAARFLAHEHSELFLHE